MWETATMKKNRRSCDRRFSQAKAMLCDGTQGRTRTGTLSPAGDFESPASTIPPLGHGEFPIAAFAQGPEAKSVFYEENLSPAPCSRSGELTR